jgi:hypothetical protein
MKCNTIVPYFIIDECFNETINILEKQISELVRENCFELVSIFIESLNLTLKVKDEILDMIIENEGKYNDSIGNKFMDFVEKKKKIYENVKKYGIVDKFEM